MAMAVANKLQFTHHTHPSSKNLIYRYNTHPRETHTQRVTLTSQGLAGGHWAGAKKLPSLGGGHSKAVKKIGHGKRTVKKPGAK